jgi:colicin import membrane protein
MEKPTHADIPGETVKRITMAADQLYEECGRSAFPNVDAVRRRARVNMNDASKVMRSWRRAQGSAATPLAATIPAPVQQACNAFLEAVWTEATNAANANLQAAQAGWDLERAEAEACREQLAVAFDKQSEELATAAQTIESLERKLRDQAISLSDAAIRQDGYTRQLTASEAQAKTADARAEEIAKRAEDLKAELLALRANAAAERDDWRARLTAAELISTGLNDELRRKSESHASDREELAHLRGQMDAVALQRQAPQDSAKPNGADGKYAGKQRTGKT